MTLPLVYLAGTPYQQGLIHGEALRDRIGHNLEVYFDRFEREVGLRRDEVLGRATHALGVIGRSSPDYARALEGLAASSGFGLTELVALNVRYEILYYQFGANAMPDGCTAFVALPEASANGHLLLGENWDWIPQVQGALLHTSEPDGLETLSFTEAGIVGGKIGLNSAGLGLSINGMNTSDDDWARPVRPFHVRCYEILRSRSFERAVAIVRDEPRACSANFVIAQVPDHAIDIEAAPDGVNTIACAAGRLVHANHFVDPEGLGVVEPPSERVPHSYHRHRRLQELLAPPRTLSIAAIQAALRDHDQHPYSVCRHEDPAEPPEEHYLTVTSVVMDLHAGELFITDGPPCTSPYERYALSGDRG